MPSLELHADKARRAIKNGLRQHPDYGSTWPFPAERDILVLWGIHRGWGISAISRRQAAQELGIGYATSGGWCFSSS